LQSMLGWKNHFFYVEDVIDYISEAWEVSVLPEWCIEKASWPAVYSAGSKNIVWHNGRVLVVVLVLVLVSHKEEFLNLCYYGCTKKLKNMYISGLSCLLVTRNCIFA
jgi:hypothetical protein